MDATLNALGGILLKAIPTLILLVLVHLYLKIMFFRPLDKVLEERRARTEGARQDAAALLKTASEKTAAYESSLREARAEIYREHEETRRRWVDEQTKRVEEVRRTSHEQIQQAKARIDAETESAKRELSEWSGTLAEQITHLLVGRSAS